MDAAFFDLDKTVIARSSGLAFGRDLYREGFINKRVLMRGIAAQFVYLMVGADENKMEQMREKVLAMTKGWDRNKVVEIIEEVMGDVITPIIFSEAMDLIREHQEQGRKVYIVSSSPEEVVVPIGKLLEVDGVIASRGKVDDEGRYVGELEFYCYGPHKADAIQALAEREGIDLTGSYAYSDSATDIPMLEVVGRPHAVNPDRSLRKEAETRDWPVLKFQSPVTLRKRLSQITPQRNTLVTGAVALGVAVAAAGLVKARRKTSVRG